MTEKVSLFFDLGDTLVDLRGLLPALASEIRGRVPGVTGDLIQVASAWARRTAEETAKAQGTAFRLGPEIAGQALREVLLGRGVDLRLHDAIGVVGRAWMAFLPQARFHGDVSTDVLTRLRARARAMAIVTDSDTALVEPLIERLRIRELFDTVLVSDQVGTYKPDPEIYRAALVRVTADPAHSLFVSNSPVDLDGAATVGMGTVLVRRHEGTTVSGRGRDWVVPGLADIVHVLDRFS